VRDRRFTPQQQTALAAANRLGYETIADPLFVSILNELADSGVIAWDEARLGFIPSEARAQPTSWALAQFQRRGPFADAAILPRKKTLPWSSTIAATDPGGDSTWINVRKLPAQPDVFA